MAGGPSRVAGEGEEEEEEEEGAFDKVKNDSDVIQKKRKDALNGRLRNVAVQIIFATFLFIAVWSPYYSRSVSS